MAIILIFIFFLISSILNIILLINSRKIYAHFNELSLNPVKEDSYLNIEGTEHDVVIFGDSHALNWKIKIMKILYLGIKLFMKV